MRPFAYQVALLLLLLSRPAAHACSPPRIEPWFSARLTAGPSELPPGMALDATAEGAGILLKNSNETPLYVLGSYDYNAEVQAALPRDTPMDYSPSHRLERDQLYQLSVDRPSTWARVPDVSALELRLDWGKLYGHGLTPILTFPSRYKQGDDRPADVDVPAPHQLDLLLAYGDRLITVPLTISYRLNADYDPRSVARAQAADCDGALGEDAAWGQTWWFVGLGVLAGLLVTFAYFRRGQTEPA